MYEPLAHHPHQMAHGLASLGRGGDSMLIHVSPKEVGGLRSLAMAAGGDLTINPHTGLPEAGFLSGLLPMLAGAAAAFLAPMTGGGSLALYGMEAGAGLAAGALSGQRGIGLLTSALGGLGGGALGSALGAGAGAAGGTAGSGAALGGNAAALGGNAAAVDGANIASLASGAGGAAGSGSGMIGGSLAQGTGLAGATAAPSVLPASLSDAAASTVSSAVPAGGAAAANVAPAAAKTGLAGYSDRLGQTGMGSLIGNKGVLAAAASPMMTAPIDQANIPAGAKQDPKFYNAVYDPKTQTYKNTNWSNQFGGQGYTGTRGTGGLGGLGGAGTYADPYTAVTAVPTQGMASGGSTSAPADQSNLKNYYTSLMNGSATTSQLPSISAAQNQAMMPQSWAPNPQFEQQALAASQPAATTAPAKTATPNTTHTYTYPVTNSSGVTTTASIPSLVWNPATQSYGPGTGGAVGASGLSGLASMINASGMPGAAGIGGLGNGSAIPGYTWDPATQSYVAAPINGMANRVIGGGKAYGGAINAFAGGGLGAFSDGGNLLRGPGDGVSDSIPAHIMGAHPQKAALADGEFVIPARIVSELGNGSTDAGAKRLYAMMDKIQQNRSKTTGNNKVAVNSRSDRFLPA